VRNCLEVIDVVCPNKSANKEDHRSSQCHLSTQSKKDEFVGQDDVDWQHAHHGRQNVLIQVLNRKKVVYYESIKREYTPTFSSPLFIMNQ
jgi:hypothetical protein